MGARVDWIFTPGQVDVHWAANLKVHAPHTHLVALISTPSDLHYKEIGMVEQLRYGTRRHKFMGDVEPCLLMNLIVSSGDCGWWDFPLAEGYYRYGFHPFPSLFYRFPRSYSAPSEIMHLQGHGLRDFIDAAVALRMNGDSSACARTHALETVKKDYRNLFRMELPVP